MSENFMTINEEVRVKHLFRIVMSNNFKGWEGREWEMCKHFSVFASNESLEKIDCLLKAYQGLYGSLDELAVFKHQGEDPDDAPDPDTSDLEVFEMAIIAIYRSLYNKERFKAKIVA